MVSWASYTVLSFKIASHHVDTLWRVKFWPTVAALRLRWLLPSPSDWTVQPLLPQKPGYLAASVIIICYYLIIIIIITPFKLVQTRKSGPPQAAVCSDPHCNLKPEAVWQDCHKRRYISEPLSKWLLVWQHISPTVVQDGYSSIYEEDNTNHLAVIDHSERSWAYLNLVVRPVVRYAWPRRWGST